MPSKEFSVLSKHLARRKTGLCMLALLLSACVYMGLRYKRTVRIPMTAGESTDIYTYERSTMGPLSTTNISTPNSLKGVLLSAYMRGGSSLTGEFFKTSSGVFYVFEPLIPFLPYHYFTEKMVCNMRDTNCSLKDAGKKAGALMALNKFYSCNIRDLPKRVVESVLYQNKSGDSWWEFSKCLNYSKENRTTDRLVGHSFCYDQIERDCRNAELRVTKVLRLGFSEVKHLLDQNSDLHILFLLRDPRAILNSRISTRWFPVRVNNTIEVNNNVESLCKKMEYDITWYKRLQDIYGKRLMHVDIANITSSRETMMGLMRTYRQNHEMHSSERMFLDRMFKRKEDAELFRDWRVTLQKKYVNYTESKCSNVLTFMKGHG